MRELDTSVSVVIPCRNERRHIIGCVDSVIGNDYTSDIEILIVDGHSTDGTREVIAKNSQRWRNVILLDNPSQTTPAALNIGIREAHGNVIVRMDAHCRYPDNYIRTLVEWLERSGADNVGATCRTLPGSDTATARAIAIALSHPFGVGNSHFRVGTATPKWVDTVPFGCYRRSVFERIGLFDEELAKNQDDEFNQRLLKSGGRILLVPDITVDYFARDSLSKVWRMYFQYGYYKPLVARKLGYVGTIRQVVPAVFVAALGSAILLSPWIRFSRFALAAILAAYAIGLLAAVVSASRKSVDIRTVGMIGAVFPALHLAYGWGSIRGIFRFLVLRRGAPPPNRSAAVSR